MKNTVSQYLAGVESTKSRESLRAFLEPMADRYSTQTLNSAGLAIGTGANTKVKIVNNTYAFVNGVLKKVAAATEVTLSGTVTNAKFNVFCILLDSSGTPSSAMGAEGATLGAVVFPAIPKQTAMIGFVIINPTGTGNFVGAAIALDDATVVPNAVYINTTGVVEPTVLVS